MIDRKGGKGGTDKWEVAASLVNVDGDMRSLNLRLRLGVMMPNERHTTDVQVDLVPMFIFRPLDRFVYESLSANSTNRTICIIIQNGWDFRRTSGMFLTRIPWMVFFHVSLLVNVLFSDRFIVLTL